MATPAPSPNCTKCRDSGAVMTQAPDIWTGRRIQFGPCDCAVGQRVGKLTAEPVEHSGDPIVLRHGRAA